MSELKYDPELPYAYIGPEGKVEARFSAEDDATYWIHDVSGAGEVIDTTPKPKIPVDAQFITWKDGAYLPQTAQRDFGYMKLGWRFGRDEGEEWYSESALLKEIGDAEVTVLVRKEDS